jgi:integrase
VASIGSIHKRSDRPDRPWRVRYRDPDGVERSKSFARRVDAQRFLEETRADVISGRYVDPARARTPFGEYALAWASRQVHRPTTIEHLDRHLRLHVIPQLGARPVGSLRKSELQAWVKGLSDGLAPATVKVISTWVGTILRAAVDDGLIVASPFRGIQIPKRDRRQVVPLGVDQVRVIAERLPDRYRALVLLGAGTGLRQGEALGLCADRIDWLGRRLRVDQQLVTPDRGVAFLGPPKSEASHRTIPLPDVVLEVLSEHVRTFGRSELGFVFTNGSDAPIDRRRFGDLWRRSITGLGLPSRTGFHALRHHYASLLIAGGESVKVVQSRLGHASAHETLETYAHLWPDSEDRTRSIIDDAMRAVSSSVAEVER